VDGLETPGSPNFVSYWYGQSTEPRHAAALMEELSAESAGRHPAVSRQAARTWSAIALTFYLRGQILTDAGLVYSEQDRRLMAAQDAWRRARQADPTRQDCSFFLGVVRARADRNRPELTAAEFAPVLSQSADRALHADILNALGDAYFEAGRLKEARQCYVESFDVFNLPSATKINYRAQRRLGGL
jgi:hypothetical protein